jgi:hypothetical protein
MEMPSALKKAWPVIRALLGGSVFAIGSELIHLPDVVISFFQSVMIKPLPAAQTLVVSTGGKAVVIGLLFALVAFIVWLLGALGAKSDGLSEAGQLFDAIATRGSQYLVHDVQMHVEITDDYSIRGTTEYRIEAVESELYAIAVSRSSSDTPCPDISKVRFRADLVEGEGTLIAVVAVDEPSEKRFLVFFDPPLKPSEKRRIRTSHNWPGSAKKKLEANKWDSNGWSWPPRCKGPVNSIKVSIRYPADSRRYESAPSSPPTGGPTVTETGWSGTFPNVQPGTGIVLRTRRAP